MSTEPKQTHRARAVLVSALLVLSIVGGATAIAGPGVADGSLTDDVNDTLDDTEEELDSAEETDDATATVTPTPTPSESDDGTTTTDEVEETTDTVEDTTETDEVEETTDTVEDTAETDEVEETTDTVEETTDTVEDTVSAQTTDLDDLAPLAIRPTRSATDSGWGSMSTTQSSTSASSGSTTSAGADPADVSITAGAANQAPIANAGEGPASLNFTEAEAGAFPDNGTAELALEPDTGLAVDPANTSATVTAEGASAQVTDVSASTVTIEVTSTDDNVTSALHLQGVRFVSAGDATTTDATWTFGNATGTTTVTPERLTVDGFGDEVARGASGVPNGGTGVIARPPTNAKSSGFVEESHHVSITIPESLEDEIAFDTSSAPTITSDGPNCGTPINPVEIEEEYFITDSQILITMSCEMGPGDYVEAKGIRFNASGANASTPAEITPQLEVQYDPVDRIESPVVDAGDPVQAHAPPVSTTGTTVEANTTNTTGEGNVTVSLSDDIGGLMGDGTRVTVALENTGVTFNESQTFDAVAISGDTPGPSVVSANATAVVLEVDGPTEAGDEFRLQRAGGDPILFDVAAGANDTALQVTTSPGEEDVTQVTETVVRTTNCQPLLEAVDTNGDGSIGDFELLDAADKWRNEEPVPGTCGVVIDDFDLLDIAEAWRNAESSKGGS